MGLKQYETRSWGTSYRGELLICAAKRKTYDQESAWHYLKNEYFADSERNFSLNRQKPHVSPDRGAWDEWRGGDELTPDQISTVRLIREWGQGGVANLCVWHPINPVFNQLGYCFFSRFCIRFKLVVPSLRKPNSDRFFFHDVSLLWILLW